MVKKRKGKDLDAQAIGFLIERWEKRDKRGGILEQKGEFLKKSEKVA